MTDEEPTGSCPTCYRRDPHEPIICRVCRSKLRSWLGDIPDLFAELEERTNELAEPLEHRPYVATVVEKVEQPDGKKVKVTTRVPTMRAADQVAYLMPAGGSSSPSRTGPVSGSQEQQIPIRVDPLDLAAPVRGLSARAELDEDAVGYLPVAFTLDFWVQDWRDARGGREGRPEPTVPALCSWLLRRADDAMDTHPAIDEMYEDVRRIHGALRAQLRLNAPKPVYLDGVPCKRCGQNTLWRMPESDYSSECAVCSDLLTEEEYDLWIRERAALARRHNRIPRSGRPAA